MVRANWGGAYAHDHFNHLVICPRHLFYAPIYHPSGSPETHFMAKQKGLPDSDHTMHDAFHYDDEEVKRAVNKRKAALCKKYGNLSSLKEEK